MDDPIVARLDELESRLAFQDDMIETLNETITRQDREGRPAEGWFPGQRLSAAEADFGRHTVCTTKRIINGKKPSSIMATTIRVSWLGVNAA